MISLIIGICMIVVLFLATGSIVGWANLLKGLFITIVVTGWTLIAIFLILEGFYYYIM